MIAPPKRRKPRIHVETMSGEDIRALRTELDLSQTEFGAFVGADQKTISRWESGTTKIQARAHKMALIKLRDHDRHLPDFEDRVRDIRFSLMMFDEVE